MIDVGYSGVIGADRITDGEPLYGDFPDDNRAGDTYGPVAYYAYVPFEQVFPWSGDWDDLPAAHAAAIFFDLATIAGLFLLGRRLRPGRARDRPRRRCSPSPGRPAPTPPSPSSRTPTTRSSPLLLVATLLVLSSPPARGALLALASRPSSRPLSWRPLFATYRRIARATRRAPPRRAPRCGPA